MGSAGPSLMSVSAAAQGIPTPWARRRVRWHPVLYYCHFCLYPDLPCISVLEPSPANRMEIFHWAVKRRCFVLAVYGYLGCLPSLRWVTASSILKYSSNGIGGHSDIMDYVSSKIAADALLPCPNYPIGWVATPITFIDEIKQSWGPFRRKKLLYRVTTSIASSVMMLVLFWSTEFC